MGCALILVEMGEGVICVSVDVTNVRSRGYLASYFTSDLSVRPVPSILFEDRDHARILVKVGEGVICVSVNVKNVRSRGYLASYFTSVSQTHPARPL
jgi:hypothetical protein